MRARPCQFGTWVLLCLVILPLSCGEDTTSPPPIEEGPVEKDPANAVSRTVGAEGGTMTTTGSDGIEYTLEIPPGALIESTRITMTPVLDIEGLGLSGGLAGAVDLQPAGLRFARAAVLRIVNSRTPAAGEQLAGFTASGDLTRRSLSPAASDTDEIVVLIPHFTVGGVGYGTVQDVSTFPVMGSNTFENLFNQLIALSFPWDDAIRAEAVQIGHDAFAQVVLPGLQNSDSDAALVDAIGAYDSWRYLLATIHSNGNLPIEVLGGGPQLELPDEFQGEVDQALAEAAEAIKAAIAGNNELCASNQSFAPLANALFWHQQASVLGIATVQYGLDRQAFLTSLCVRAFVEEFELPANMQVGFPHSLDVRFGLEFGLSGTTGAPFRVTVTGDGIDIANPTGFTDSQGNYTTVITATETGALGVTVRGCLVMPETTVETDVCAEGEAGVSSGIDLTGDYIGASGGLFGEPFTMVQVEQNQNAITGTFQTRDGGSYHTGRFLATLAGTALLGVTYELDGCDVTGATPQVGSVEQNGDKITLRIPRNGADCHGHNLPEIVVCGPSSSLNQIDLGGTYSGSFALNTQKQFYTVTATFTGGFGAISGTFTGERTGTISADLALSPLTVGCIFGHLTNIQITFTDCPLIQGGTMDDGCLVYQNGIVSLALSTNSGWLDGCESRELLGFSFSKAGDLCGGN